ncbi:exonuclease domain-containing protein [Aliidiomarina sp. Khilg15.8]
MKTLPEKYYLSHFHEFMAYLVEVCPHLLDEDDRSYLSRIASLSEDAQCVLVRIFNRQADFVRIESLAYAEIADHQRALMELRHKDLVQAVSAGGYTQFIQVLNKAELIELAQHAAVKMPVKSARKAQWQAAVQAQVNFELANPALLGQFIEQVDSQRLSYLLFLYFGHLRGRLTQFSMRDLGIMQTRQLRQQPKARFARLAEAKTAFLYAELNHRFKVDPESANDIADQHYPAPVGAHAETQKDKLFHRLGKYMTERDEAQALALLAQSNADGAVEKRLRLQYQRGDTVLSELERLIDDPPSETLYVFAQDFLQRKYHKKRTSVLTDMLRQSAPPIALDEAFVGAVETGVQQYYERQGLRVYHSENRLWRALFGLTFWHELFENEAAGLSNEFDRLPLVLRQNVFYQQMATAIEKRLQQVNSPASWKQYLLRISSAQYGKVNGVFRWHPQMLEALFGLLEHASTDALQQQLRAMSADYHALSDGYPDLMLIEQGQLRFEEIKAPGDSLRRNQLISLQRLQASGFDVRVQSAYWQYDPAQPYVVVDVETTGGHHASHRVTEVGMVKIQHGKVVDSWQSLINPERHIPGRITQLTGIDDDMVKNAPVFAEVAAEVEEFLHGSIFVAHNVNFDYGFIKRELERAGAVLRLPKLCTVRLARQYFPGLASYSLGRLCAALGIRLTRHHRALDDAQAAAEVLLQVQEKRW